MCAGVYPNPNAPIAPPEPDTIAISLVVDASLHGYRLDRFLHARIPRLSRTRLQEIIAAGQVRRAVEREPLRRASARVHAGESLILVRPAPPEPPVVLDYRVVFEDADLLVLDKPAGLPVHPSARYHRHTLTALMRERLGAEHGWEMAHRLDRETSGVLVFGRGRQGRARGDVASASFLKRAFAHRQVEKHYVALVRGRLDGPLRITVALGPARDSTIRIKMGPRSTEDGGLPAVTDVSPLLHGSFRDEPITMVVARPRTGRQHQIRVHLATVDHPVLGDKLYGIDERHFLGVVEQGASMELLHEHLGLARHALHAARLDIVHPRLGTPCTFTAPWPAELERILPYPTDAGRSDPRAP
jgi:23S rRNA pseudouridine1911/1915/1917 synthase